MQDHHALDDDAFVHARADVASDVEIGAGTKIWQFVVVLAGARLGRNCNICAHVLIEGDVVVGNNVTVKPGVQLWNGMRIGDDVFVGPNVTFSNDRLPRSGNREFQLEPTVLREGCSIGAGAVLLPGVTIGRGAMVGAGAVVTRDVAENTVVMGNPARPA